MVASLSTTFSESVPDACGTLVIYATPGPELGGRAREMWDRTGRDFAALAATAGFEGKAGHVLDILAPEGLDCDRLVVLGMGKPSADKATLGTWRDRGGSLASKLSGLSIRKAAVVIDEGGADAARIAELVAGLHLRHYSFDKYRTTANGNGDKTRGDLALTLCVSDRGAVEAAASERLAVVEGTLLARTLVNEPPNVLGPVEFAGIANGLSEHGLKVQVLTPEEMAERGMNALLAVARGSERPARLVVMEWQGGARGEAPLAFVGKGVVFDTGGISIKPGASMEDMKGDMGGAAAVTGLMKALAVRKAKVNAVGILGVVENMPDGRSYRPGDIITAMSGKTIEIVNTDAEGRLVLADALWYAQTEFKPRLVIDLATLTGAVLVALGHAHGGMFTDDEDLARKLIAAGQMTGETVWHMPMGEYFEKLIESRFADIKNSGGRKGGSSTAAHFLRHFIKDTPWVHLDIAGMAFGAPNSETNTSWGTGYGVALLDRFIRESYEG